MDEREYVCVSGGERKIDLFTLLLTRRHSREDDGDDDGDDNERPTSKNESEKARSQRPCHSQPQYRPYPYPATNQSTNQ